MTFGAVCTRSRSQSRSSRCWMISRCEHAQEAAAEAEAQPLADLRLVDEAESLSLSCSSASRSSEVVVVGREQAAEDHRLGSLYPVSASTAGLWSVGDGVADVEPGDVLDLGHEVADLADCQTRRTGVVAGGTGRLLGVVGCRCAIVCCACPSRACLPRHERRRRRPCSVEVAVVDERAGGASRSPAGAETRSMMASMTSSTPSPVFAAMRQHVARVVSSRSATRRPSRPGRLWPCRSCSAPARCQVVFDREVRIRDGLRLHPLRGVDEQERPSHAAASGRLRSRNRRGRAYRRGSARGRSTYRRDGRCMRMVMPRSRSRSIESRIWLRNSRADDRLGSLRRRSQSVLLPWSMWAMIEKLRMWLWSIPRAMVLGGRFEPPGRVPEGQARAPRSLDSVSNSRTPSRRHTPKKAA